MNPILYKILVPSCILFLLLMPRSFAENIKAHFEYKDWDQAENAQNRLQFVVESVKAGFIASDVDGYAKKFSYSADFDQKKLILKRIRMVIEVNSMDTDNQSRDEKLHNLCMSYKDFPRLELGLDEEISIKNPQTQTYQGWVNIRGKKKKFSIELTSKLEEGILSIEGKSEWSLKEMEIPDPSIFIAKLSDSIRIHIKIQEKIN